MAMMMTRMRYGLMLGALVSLGACGGGQTGSPISGKLMDGYIKGALVCLDVNQNMKCDVGEPATNSGEGGTFTVYPLKNTSTAGLLLIAEIGAGSEDADTPGQVLDETRLLGFAERPAVVSPLTTVVASLVAQGMSLGEAEIRARSLLGFSTSVDFSRDYVAAGDNDTHQVAKAVFAVTSNVFGGGTPNATSLINTLTAVQDSLRKTPAELTAALSQLFNKEDVTVGDFDGSTPTFGGIGGADATVVSAPTGGTGNALSVVRVVGSEAFAGVAVDLAKAVSGSQYYSASARVHVDARVAGRPVKLKLESADGSMQSDEIESREVPVAGWQTLTWIWSTSPGRTFNKLIVLPNVGAAGSGESYDFDDIGLFKGRVLANFDVFTPGFFGANGSAVVTKEIGPTGGTGNALRVTKNTGDSFAGAIINLDAPLRNGTSYLVSARVWSPAAGIPMVMKISNFNDATQTVQTSSKESVVQGWQTLTWEFTGAVDLWFLQKMFFQPADGSQGSGESYYIDDIKLRTSSVRLANFDDVVPSFFGSSGSADVTSGAGPVGGTGSALKVAKNPGDTWAGAAINLDWVIKGATSYTLSAQVYSPSAGSPMILKLVNLNDESQSVQASSRESVVIGWQTMTWDFSGAQDWWFLNKLYFQPNDGVVGTGEAYYLDEVRQLVK